MLETMYVRCTHCGYDNSPEYRFCGMCGASLAHPPVQTQVPEKKEVHAASNSGNGGNGTSENVHGPSFLGLAEDPKVEFHYLYEDEQPRSHVGLVVFLLLILGATGYLGWQWKHGGFPFNRQLAGSSNNGAQTSASPSEVAPAQTENQETHIDKPMTGGAGSVQPLPPEPQQTQTPGPVNKPPEAAAKSPETGTPASNSAAAGTAASDKSASDKSAAEESPAEPAAPVKSQSPKQASVRT